MNPMIGMRRAVRLAWQRRYLPRSLAFTVALVPLQADRDAAERALYLHFRSSCNTQVPTGLAYLVTPLTSAWPDPTEPVVHRFHRSLSGDLP